MILLIVGFIIGFIISIFIWGIIDMLPSSEKKRYIKKICKFYNIVYKKNKKKMKNMDFSTLMETYNFIINKERKENEDKTNDYLKILNESRIKNL